MISVLIIDDEQKKLGSIRERVEGIGAHLPARINVDIALSGADAMDKIRKSFYDICIADLCIPWLIGEEPSPEHCLNFLKRAMAGGRHVMPCYIIGMTQHLEMYERYKSDYDAMLLFLLKYEEDWTGKIRSVVQQAIKSRNLYGLNRFSSAGVKKVGLVCALRDPELSAACSVWNLEKSGVLSGTGQNLYQSEIRIEGSSLAVYASCCPEMGMSSAASIATTLIENYGIDILLMTGITGGIEGKVEIGDVVAFDPCWNYTLGKYEAGGFRLDPRQLRIQPAMRRAVEELQEQNALLAAWHSEFSGSPKPPSVPQLLIGPGACGGGVVADSLKADEVKQQARKLVAIEMESYGIYQAGRLQLNGGPDSLVVKAVSDHCDSSKANDYQFYCSYISAKCALEIIKNRVRDWV